MKVGKLNKAWIAKTIQTDYQKEGCVSTFNNSFVSRPVSQDISKTSKKGSKRVKELFWFGFVDTHSTVQSRDVQR